MFNKIYLISTINIFIQQYTFAFNFNPGYFHSTTNTRSTSTKKVNMLFNKNIYSTSSFAILIQHKYVFNFKLHHLYSRKIFIQLQPSLSLFNKNIYSTSKFNKVKFPDIPTNIHSTNLPVPTPADLQTLPSLPAAILTRTENHFKNGVVRSLRSYAKGKIV